MSWWTHTRGIMVVNCWYSSKFDFNQIMAGIIKHAPSVTGSEGNLEIGCVQDPGYDTAQYKKDKNGEYIKYTNQSRFSLIFNGDFRDRVMDETKRELESLLQYLGCRLLVDTCYVEVYDDFDKRLYTGDSVVPSDKLTLKELGIAESPYAVDAVKELNTMYLPHI